MLKGTLEGCVLERHSCVLSIGLTAYAQPHLLAQPPSAPESSVWVTSRTQARSRHSRHSSIAAMTRAAVSSGVVTEFGPLTQLPMGAPSR